MIKRTDFTLTLHNVKYVKHFQSARATDQMWRCVGSAIAVAVSRTDIQTLAQAQRRIEQPSTTGNPSTAVHRQGARSRTSVGMQSSTLRNSLTRRLQVSSSWPLHDALCLKLNISSRSASCEVMICCTAGRSYRFLGGPAYKSCGLDRSMCHKRLARHGI